MKNNLKKRKDYGTLNSLDIDELIAMKIKQRYLDMHPYAVWQGKDGKHWFTTFPDSTRPRGVRQLKRNTKEEIEALIIEYWEAHSTKTPVEAVFADWNDNRLAMKKIGELTHLRNEQFFTKYFSSIKEKNIEELTARDFVDFLESRVAEDSITSKTFSSIKGIVRGILKHARKESLISFTEYDVFGSLDVSDRSFKKVIKEDDEEVFDEREMNLVVNYLCENPDIRNLAILLMFVTGLRVGELVALKCCDFVDNTVRVRRMEIRVPNPDGGSTYEIKDYPKTDAGVRNVIVPEGYIWLLEKLCYGDPDRYVFRDERGVRLTTNSIRKRLTNVCDILNIKHKSPHKIRKTYCSILLDNNVDRRFVIEQSGHADISCTEKHYHINRRTEKNKSEIINAIPDFRTPSNIPDIPD